MFYIAVDLCLKPNTDRSIYSSPMLYSKNELLKEFVTQHLQDNTDRHIEVRDNTPQTPDLANEIPVVLDREAFLKRLQTYSALFTYGKPITPVECARHGWIDTREHQVDHLVSKLRCELCSGVVYVTDVKHGASDELCKYLQICYLFLCYEAC